MTAKIKPYDRLKLIKKAEKGEPVAKICRQTGISRQVFYKWQKRYKKNGKVASLIPKGAKPDDWNFYNRLSPKERLVLIERVKNGESVVKVAGEYNVSRHLFYKWLKRYDSAPIGQKLEALWDKKPVIERYFNQSPEEYEEAVLSAVGQYPELSSHSLVEVLPKIGSKPILSNHGVYNILRRYNLTTYQKRLEYSQSQIRASGFRYLFQPVWEVLDRLVRLNPAARIFTTRVGFIFLLSAFSAVVFWGLVGFVRLISANPSITFSLGTVFALVSLLFGMFFFIYSLKYYLTIAMVLSFSRKQEMEEGQSNIFSKLFGIYRKTMSGGKDEKVIGAGLLPDTSEVLLDRQPFISVHVALYNEKRVVERLLTALTSFTYENYEVIIADDSTDETYELLLKWKDHPRVKISHRENRTGFKGAALKQAMTIMDPKTEFIAVFDADFIPYPDSLSQFLKYYKVSAGSLVQNDYKQSNIAAVQGYQWHVLNKSENWVTRGVRSEYSGSYVLERSGIEIYEGLKQISGSVYMIRRDVLEKVGWGTSITEDFELTLRLYEKGYKVVYTPYVQAPAEAVSTIKRLIRQRMRWAEGQQLQCETDVCPLTLW